MEGLSNRRSKAVFSDGLVWMEGLTVEVKLHFLTGKCWMEGLTAEVKLRFLTD